MYSVVCNMVLLISIHYVQRLLIKVLANLLKQFTFPRTILQAFRHTTTYNKNKLLIAFLLSLFLIRGLAKNQNYN